MSIDQATLEAAAAPEPIRRFAADARKNQATAVTALQAQLQAAEGPLTEEHATGRVRVTFVHIGPAREVRVLSQLLPSTSMLGTAMVRVADTDVWWLTVEADSRVETTYQFQVDPPELATDPEELLAVMSDPDRLAGLMRQMFQAAYADPFNPRRNYPIAGMMGADPDQEAGEEHFDSLLVLPGAEPFPYLGSPQRSGRLTDHEFDSSALPGKRTVSVYTPPGYEDSQTYPLVIMLDGEMALACGRLDEVLDAAILDGAVPPVVVAFWHNLSIASRMTEMACNPALPAALADELLPFMRDGWSVTTDSSRTVLAGASYGGLATAHAALERGDAFGSALVMSPSLWFAPPTVEGAPAEGPGWLTRQYAGTAKRPVRFAVAVGTLEDQPLPLPGGDGTTMLALAREFRDTLEQMQYDVVAYVEQPAGHDFVNVQRVLVHALPGLCS